MCTDNTQPSIATWHLQRQSVGAAGEKWRRECKRAFYMRQNTYWDWELTMKGHQPFKVSTAERQQLESGYCEVTQIFSKGVV